MNNDERLQTLLTIGDWIRYAATSLDKAELFFGHGYESAWDEAVQLVLTRLRLPIHLNTHIIHNHLLFNERVELLETIQQRIMTRMPLAYILQEAWFCGLSLYVDQRVLIPRSPIGELIEKQFEPWVDPNEVRTILDIGTGSACMAIAAAMAFPQAMVDAVDINEEALAVAAININRYHLESRVHLYQSDCFSDLNYQRYDIIMSNPPYVSAVELANLPPEYQHEPRTALYADQDGMAIVSNILQQAATHLTEHGILIIEVGHSQEAMLRYFPDLPLVWLEFERGGQGVFLLTAEQLQQQFLVS